VLLVVVKRAYHDRQAGKKGNLVRARAAPLVDRRIDAARSFHGAGTAEREATLNDDGSCRREICPDITKLEPTAPRTSKESRASVQQPEGTRLLGHAIASLRPTTHEARHGPSRARP
jgi:hypothetical protein